jgi:hypothetical protein
MLCMAMVASSSVVFGKGRVMFRVVKVECSKVPFCNCEVRSCDVAVKFCLVT